MFSDVSKPNVVVESEEHLPEMPGLKPGCELCPSHAGPELLAHQSQQPWMEWVRCRGGIG